MWPHDLPDLEPEATTEAEFEGIDKLRKAIFESRGITEPEKGTEHHYRKSVLIRFYRARKGKIKKSVEMFNNMLEWWYESFQIEEKVKKWEENESDEAKVYPSILAMRAARHR